MQIQRQEVMDILRRINKKLFTANDDSFIGIGQINILKEIIDHEMITQDELASILNLDKTTVAKAVKRLEIHNLIIRNRNKTDQRKKELVATPKALAVKEFMTKHMEDSSKLIFEGVTEQEIETFKNVLEKIEKNIEKKKSMVNEKKQTGMKILKLIEKNENVNVQELAELLGKEVEEIKEVIEKLIIKELIEEKNGVLSITQKAKEREKEFDSMENIREKRHKEHKELFMYILKNNGLSKEELVQKSGKSADEIDSLLKHLVSKEVVEIRDGKIYADKEAVKKKHKQ